MGWSDRTREPLHAFDWTSSESTSVSLVTALSEVSGDDVTAIEPLHDVVDPDALDRLFPASGGGGSRHAGRVTFTYHGYRVVVDANGRGYVYDLDAGGPMTTGLREGIVEGE